MMMASYEKSNSCNQSSSLSVMPDKTPELLTDIQWRALEKQFIYGKNYDAIGKQIGLAK